MNISSKMDSHFTGLWVNFFTAAGIPSEVSATYALTFTENRIQNDMLLDLNKEYLRDMGITRMGDVIAILRHAKQVHENAARDRVLNSASPGLRVPVAAVAGRLTVAQSKPSSPATRMLEHYTRKASPAEASPPHQAPPAKRKSADNVCGNDSVMEIKKTRSIRFSSPLPASSSDAAAAASKQTVFARLGNTEQTTKPAASTQTTKPIYSRLGAKADDKSPNPPIPVPKDALKYEGILKTSPLPIKKTISITASKNNVRKIAVGTMRADETPISVKEKLAITKPAVSKALPTKVAAPVKGKCVKFSNKVEYKEIDSVKAKPVSVFNKPERRLAMPAANSFASSSSDSNNGVKARLGNKNTNNLTITKNVFNRLGV